MPRLPRWFFPRARHKWNIRRALVKRSQLRELDELLRSKSFSPATEQMLREEVAALKAMASDHLRRAEELHTRKKK